MKILHIAPIGHHAEGIGSVLKMLVPKQMQLGHDVIIISIYVNKTYTNLPIISIRNTDEFNELLIKWIPDIVQFHSVYKKQYISFSNILRKHNIPYVVQMHGALSRENYKKSHLKKWIANLLFFNKFLKRAQYIVYLSEAERKQCIVNGINHKAAIIPNGCEYHQDIIYEHKLLPVTRIVYIGRINLQQKGLDILLKAVNLLCGSKANFKLDIYGNTDDVNVEELKTLTSNNSLVEYKGGIYGKNKDSLLRECDIFILTSPSEGMSMGLLEAFSYGIPCIVTPGTNMSDVISRNKAGWVAEYDEKSIANTIILAIQEYRKRPSYFRKNAHLLSKKYDWNVISKESIKVLEKVLSL